MYLFRNNFHVLTEFTAIGYYLFNFSMQNSCYPDYTEAIINSPLNNFWVLKMTTELLRNHHFLTNGNQLNFYWQQNTPHHSFIYIYLFGENGKSVEYKMR